MEGRGEVLIKSLGFRSWHSGRQAGRSLNKELDFRLWHSQRKLGSNTSVLRTNRILRLEMMQGGSSHNNT